MLAKPCNGSVTTQTYSNFVFHDSLGRTHPFGGNTWEQTSACSGPPTRTDSGNFVGTATDGSGLTLTELPIPNQGGWTVTDTNGNINSGGSSTYTDSNGNQITANTGTGAITDTTGNVALTFAGTAPTATTFQYTDTNGNPQTVTLNYTTYTVQTAFNCSNIAEYGPTSTSLVSSISFPDGSLYQFTYEPTPGVSGNVTGRLASVTLPQGGTINYTYSGGSNGIVCADGSTAGLTRKLATSAGSAASTWTYTRTPGTGTSTTAVADGLGNNKSYSFVEASNQPAGTTAEYYETSRNVYQGAATGTPLLARQTCYNSANHPCVTTAITLPITRIDYFNSFNGGGLDGSAQTYNSYGLVTSQGTWDYGSASSRGAILRTEALTYSTSGIPGLVAQDEVFDVSDNETGNTTYAYDGTTPTASSGVPQHVAETGARGNLTSLTQYASPGTSYTSTFTYEDTGSLLTSTTPNGKTTMSYDPTFVYNTGVSLPTPSSGVALSTSATFDTAHTGLPLSYTDPNGQITEIASNEYDSLLRPLEVNYPDGGETLRSYTPTLVATSHLLTRQVRSSSDSEVQLDGYGRQSSTEVDNGQIGSPWYQQDTCYDANGNVAFKSYTYQGTGFGASKVCSGSGGDTYTYDALGRVLQVTHGDSSHINYGYTGRATQVTDENGVSRIVQVDGLGRPKSVCEISATTMALQGVAPVACSLDIDIAGSGFLTTYVYSTDTTSGNAQKTVVTQGAQTRTFETDWLGRTTQIMQPESGTTTYSYAYNNIGLVVTRQRPTANQTSASTLTTTTTEYDSLGRLENISYSDGTPTKHYLYDANSGFAAPQSNLKGRLSVATASTSPTFSGTAFSYDAVGRIIALSECLPGNCGTPADDKNLAYTYDYAGDLTSSTDAAGATTTYTYSVANEVESITSNASSLSSATLPGTIVSNVQNGPFGPVSYTLGNGVSQFNSYDMMGRLNGESICPVGTTAALGCSGQIYGFTATWKGQQLQSSSDSVEGTGITYGYDNFNRLTSLTNSSKQPLYTYTYDRYGNRWSQQPGSGVGSGSTFNVAYNSSTNQITATGYTYDAAGNLMSDGTNSYTYDADGNLTGLVSSGYSPQFTYNALNQQVAQSTSQDESLVVFDKSGNLASLWLAGSGQLLGKAYWGAAAIESYNPANNTALFAHRDWVGTRRAVTGETGGTNAIVSSLPFGDDTTNVSGGPGNTFDGFTGLWASAPTTDHAQFREYSNIAGRWLSPDPYAGSYDLTNPQSMNRYAYVLNNPMSFVDPSGLCPDGLVEDDEGHCTRPPGNFVPPDMISIFYCSLFPGLCGGGGGGQPSQTSGGGGPSASAPSKPSLLHIAACAIAAPVIGAAQASNRTVGVGLGGSAGAGFILGLFASVGVQIVADPQGNAGLAVNVNTSASEEVLEPRGADNFRCQPLGI